MSDAVRLYKSKSYLAVMRTNAKPEPSGGEQLAHRQALIEGFAAIGVTVERVMIVVGYGEGVDLYEALADQPTAN